MEKETTKEDIKEITNWLHSLFVIKRKDEYKKEWENYKKIPSYTLYRLYINDFDNYDKENPNKINSIFNELEESKENDNLSIRISSNGWAVYELMRFKNIIESKFKGHTVTILNNHWYSCGALLFLLGDERIISEDSILMFHYYSWHIWGKWWEIKTQSEFQDKYYKKFFSKMMNPYFTKEEIEEMIIGKDFWLDADDMVKRGIATLIK